MRLPFAIQTVYPFTFVLALHISFFPAIQARAETRQEVARTAIIQNLNQTLVETDLLEKELSVYATIDLESVNRENKLNRWTKKLTDRLPNISEKISKDIQKMSDVQVSESLTHAIETLGISREVNKTERENLEVILKNEASKKIPIIAHAIVDHGGIIPFIFDLKNAIRAEKDRWSWFPKKADRTIASVRGTCALAWIITVACLAIFFLASALTGTLLPLLCEILGGAGTIFMVLIGYAFVCD